MSKLIRASLVLMLVIQLPSCVRAQNYSPILTVKNIFDNNNVVVKLYANRLARYPEWNGENPPMSMQVALQLARTALGRSHWSDIPMSVQVVALRHVSSKMVYSLLPIRTASLKVWVYVVEFQPISKEHTGLLPMIVLFDGNVLTPENSK